MVWTSSLPPPTLNHRMPTIQSRKYTLLNQQAQDSSQSVSIPEASTKHVLKCNQFIHVMLVPSHRERQIIGKLRNIYLSCPTWESDSPKSTCNNHFLYNIGEGLPNVDIEQSYKLPIHLLC